MSKIFNILVLCTRNSVRSILAEALFNHHGAGRVRAWSAGSEPAGAVNPLALETLQAHGIAMAAARSKSWKEFSVSPVSPSPNSAPNPGPDHFDFVVTVCGSAADARGPVWPGRPTAVHWAFPIRPRSQQRTDARLSRKPIRRWKNVSLPFSPCHSNP